MVIYTGKANRPHGQVVKTAPSHGAISGSNPLGVTSNLKECPNRHSFYFCLVYNRYNQIKTKGYARL